MKRFRGNRLSNTLLYFYRFPLNYFLLFCLLPGSSSATQGDIDVLFMVIERFKNRDAERLSPLPGARKNGAGRTLLHRELGRDKLRSLLWTKIQALCKPAIVMQSRPFALDS